MRFPGIFSSLPSRATILLLLVILIIFALGGVIRSYFHGRRLEIESAEHISLLLARSLAAQQKQIEVTTKEVLTGVAQSPEMQKLDPNSCNSIFHRLNSRYQFYSVLGAVTPDGNLFACSEPFEQGSINISDQRHIREAISSLDFSAGEYLRGTLTGIQTIHYGLPVIDSSNRLIAVLVAGFRLDRYAGLIAKANLPMDSVVVITDHKGIRLYRSPENQAAMPGESIPPDMFERMANGPDEGFFESTGSDGTLRINSYKRLYLREGLPPYLYIAVGIAKDKLLQNVNFSFYSSLFAIGIVALAAIGLVILLPDFPKKQVS